jgi:hypothetical protein
MEWQAHKYGEATKLIAAYKVKFEAFTATNCSEAFSADQPSNSILIAVGVNLCVLPTSLACG